MNHRTHMLLIWGVSCLLSAALRAQIADHVVVSEFYGGGGNAGALFRNDFIELYNPTSTPVTMSNWSIQYTSASSGTYSAKTIFSGVIGAHGFFLIQEAQGSGGSLNLPAADAVGTLNFASSNGKIGLVSDTLAISGHNSPGVVDFVGYGTANDAEGGSPVTGLDNTHSAERKALFTSTSGSMGAGGSDVVFGNGYDSNINGNDFVAQAVQVPQNSASPPEDPPSGNQVPVIGTISRSPYIPGAGASDTITAIITDDGIIAGAKVHLRVNGGSFDSSMAMASAGPSVWIAVVPAAKHPANGALVEYFVSAIDDSLSSVSTERSIAGYFVGDAPIISIKAHPLEGISGYAARVHGTINVQTNTFANGLGGLQDATGGLLLFRTGGLPPLAAGRDARVQGPIISFNGAYEMSPPTFVDTVGTSPLAPFALTLPLTESAANTAEGKLVTVASLVTDSTGTFAAGKNYVYKSASNDTITVRVESYGSANNLVGNSIVAAPVSVTGILSYASGYLRLKPRNQIDLGFDPADGSGTASISPQSRLANATAAAETLMLTGDAANTIRGVSVSIPSSWSWSDTSAKSIAGSGFASAASSVSGDGSPITPYIVTITGASVTNGTPGRLVLSGLTVPAEGGNSEFLTKTRGSAGILTPIAVSPVVAVLTSGYEAVLTGAWSDPATWSGGVVPGAGDDVTMTTLGVTITIDIPDAHCRDLTMTGAGSAANSGPLLQFSASGTPQLTVHGRIRIAGGSGSGQGGRAKMTSNGNAGATLVLKGGIMTTTSNSTASGNAGLNMNEGTVRIEGAATDTLTNSSGLRLAHLRIGDGLAPTTLVWVPTRKSTLVVRSLLVRSGSAFLIGAANDSTANDVGNATSSGVPTLNGGITVEAGARIAVQEFAGGPDAAAINVDAGGVTNHGIFDLRSASATSSAGAGCHYDLRVGEFSAAASGVKQFIGGNAPTKLANVIVDATDTLALQQDVVLGSPYKLTLKGRLAELPGATVWGTIEAIRPVARNMAEDFGGIGAVITAFDAAPGVTTARRVTGSRLGAGSNTSILRSFEIVPALNAGLNAEIDYTYDEDELDGQSAFALQLWKSSDGGTHWILQPSANEFPEKRLHAVGIASFARITAADPDHALGRGGTSIDYRTGWNMISLPVTPPTYEVQALYPQANSPAFAFEGGYSRRDTLKTGIGYWLRFASPETLSIPGTPRGSDTVTISPGWNMIGSISVPVQTSAISDIPPGILTSPLFAFDGSYYRADIVIPGYGYWIKAKAPGKLVLSSGEARLIRDPKESVEMFSSIHVADEEGHGRRLYFGSGEKVSGNADMYELPPIPPAGCFDARFADNSTVAYGMKGAVTRAEVKVQSAGLPLHLRWEGANEHGCDASLSIDGRHYDLSHPGSVVLDHLPGETILTITHGATAAGSGVFSLEGNFPNPFNPTTTISFVIASAARVVIDVYDILGRKVATPLDEWLGEGSHVTEWNGKNFDGRDVSAGVYCLRLTSGELRAEKKVLLLR